VTAHIRCHGCKQTFKNWRELARHGGPECDDAGQRFV
jgi:protein-arginine kinase activator protein McsA